MPSRVAPVGDEAALRLGLVNGGRDLEDGGRKFIPTVSSGDCPASPSPSSVSAVCAAPVMAWDRVQSRYSGICSVRPLRPRRLAALCTAHMFSTTGSTGQPFFAKPIRTNPEDASLPWLACKCPSIILLLSPPADYVVVIVKATAGPRSPLWLTVLLVFSPSPSPDSRTFSLLLLTPLMPHLYYPSA